MTTPEPGTAALISLWDDATPLDRAGRAGVLAAAVAGEDQSHRSVGHVHARVLELRAALLGDVLTAHAACPACGEPVEVEVSVADLLPLEGKIFDDPAQVVHGGWTVRWHPPTVADLAAVAQVADATAALLRRCVEDARDALGAGHPGDRLPADVRVALAEALDDADPLAEVVLAPSCPSCATSFLVDLDVVDFVFTEVDRLARATLLDVDVLARAYGWTEADVLALSPARRTAYLAIVSDGAR